MKVLGFIFAHDRTVLPNQKYAIDNAAKSLGEDPIYPASLKVLLDKVVEMSTHL